MRRFESSERGISEASLDNRIYEILSSSIFSELDDY